MWSRWLGAAGVLLLSACSTQGPQPAPAVPATPAQRPSAAALAQSDAAKFAAFVRSFRAEALAAGIRPELYDRAMSGLSPNPRIAALENKQPEFVRPVWSYLDGAVSGLRIKTGQQQIGDRATALANIESRYGVPKEILVAIWGMESDYGAGMGSFNMVQALATLAYDGRRTELGRRELLDALKMAQREGYDPTAMTSSWAGAFGHTQFMPSTFLAHAVDGDGDGHIDLWHSPEDALASTAALLAADGWRAGEPCVAEVHLPADFPFAQADLDQAYPADHWRSLGVTTITGGTIDDNGEKLSIFLPAGANGPAFLIYPNFRIVLRYNASTSYALAISELAIRLGGGAGVLHSWPRDQQPLNHDEALAFQRDLKALGYDPGAIDGLIGTKVRAALRDYQAARGLVPDGFATLALLQRMEQELAARGS